MQFKPCFITIEVTLRSEYMQQHPMTRNIKFAHLYLKKTAQVKLVAQPTDNHLAPISCDDDVDDDER